MVCMVSEVFDNNINNEEILSGIGMLDILHQENQKQINNRFSRNTTSFIRR